MDPEMVIGLNAATLLLAVVVFILLQPTRVHLVKTVALSSFFLCGAVVAKIQWMLLTDADESEVGWEMAAAVPLIMIASIVGMSAAIPFFREDWVLKAIVVMTIGLAILQSGWSLLGGVEGTMQDWYAAMLNWYARAYAAICLAAPIVVLMQDEKAD
jgi:hypothetical protein